ncbi:unnamed protein product [Linum trigynum]|uniref:DUF4283 domain-containing protein n=1 Tax=Linum trigynum TaxID=586398 RepID=A0AAV2D8K2_9ROSI
MEEAPANNQVDLNLGWEEEDYEVAFPNEEPYQQVTPRLRLVGKVLGERDVSKRAMVGMINGAWSHFSEPTVQDIPKFRNIFIFIFNHKEEMDRVWEGRPWQISGNTLQLKPWEENIRPQNINFYLADY